jgi:hypothetical protein
MNTKHIAITNCSSSTIADRPCLPLVAFSLELAYLFTQLRYLKL